MSGATDFDRPALSAWLVAHKFSGSGVFGLEPLSGGQSNPTFRLDTDGASYVLRKRPSGLLIPSAHAIDREYRVMKALRATPVPVPAMLAWCDDESVIGAAFYLMEYLEGRVIMDPSIPGASPGDRREIYAEVNRVIALLHAVDAAAAGLEDFGRKGGYVARQIARWSKQCEASSIPLPPAMHRLIEWLPQHLPDGDSTSIVHGDFRFDNLVLHPVAARVIGILDWELSTLGDPIADFAYHCMSWRIPANLWRGIAGLDLKAYGLPTEAEYVRSYEAASGRETGSHWEFYMAYNLFRMAAILHGIAERASRGTASSPDAAQTGAKAAPLAEIGWDCALRHQALHSH